MPSDVREELQRNLKAQRKSAPAPDTNPPDGLPNFPGTDTVNNALTGVAAIGGALASRKLFGKWVGRELAAGADDRAAVLGRRVVSSPQMQQFAERSQARRDAFYKTRPRDSAQWSKEDHAAFRKLVDENEADRLASGGSKMDDAERQFQTKRDGGVYAARGRTGATLAGGAGAAAATKFRQHGPD